jgi:hypothetical protein
MLHPVIATMTLHFPTATYTTIVLSLALSAFGFYAGGYYGGHSTLSSETAAGVRRTWVPIFLLIGLGGLLFALRKLMFAPSPNGAYADASEVVIITAISSAFGLAVTLVAIVGLHERFAKATAWTIATLPLTAFVITETLVIREALRPYGPNQGPENALYYFGAYEIIATLFMLFVVYGPRALGERDPNALLMLTGLVLLLVAPLIYTLGTSSGGTSVVIDTAGWFIACHLAGLLFVFLASLPAGEAMVAQHAPAVEPSVMQHAPLPLPMPSTAAARFATTREDSVPAYTRSAAVMSRTAQ